MHVQFNTIVDDSQVERYQERVEFDDADPCCDEMEKHCMVFREGLFGGGLRGFGPIVFGDGPEAYEGPSLNVVETRGRSGETEYEKIPINCCPWCGAPISFEEMARFRMVEETKTVEQEVTETRRERVEPEE